MSVARKELLDLIGQIPENQVASVVLYLKDTILKPVKKEFDPEKYWGILKDTDINIDEECKKLRDEWDRDFY